MLIHDFKEAMAELESASSIALDIETTGLSPWRDRIAVISMHSPGRRTCVLQTPLGRVPPELGKFLARPGVEWLTHNGTGFDLKFFATKGIWFSKGITIRW